MSERRVVKVEKQVTESWEVWWANGAACFVPTGQGVYRTYRGEEEKLAGTHPEVQSAVRQCWEENRPLGEDEVRRNGRVVTLERVSRDRVFTDRNTFFTLGPVEDEADARILAYHKAHYTLQPSEYRDPETGLIKDLAEDECRDSRGRVCKMIVQRANRTTILVTDHDKVEGCDFWYFSRHTRNEDTFPRDQYETRILPFLEKHLEMSETKFPDGVSIARVIDATQANQLLYWLTETIFSPESRVRITVERLP